MQQANPTFNCPICDVVIKNLLISIKIRSKAGIVTEPGHYLYRSARNYARLPALMDVTLIEIVPLDGYMRPLGCGDGGR